MSNLTLDEAIKHCHEVAEKNDGEAEVYDLLAKNHNNPYEKLTASRFHADCAECAADHRQLAEWLTELKEAKRLLKAAVEDFAKLDRMNTKVRNCMIPDMDCADCPLNWDSVDDSIEPCHNWRYTDEAERLLKGE